MWEFFHGKSLEFTLENLPRVENSISTGDFDIPRGFISTHLEGEIMDWHSEWLLDDGSLKFSKDRGMFGTSEPNWTSPEPEIWTSPGQLTFAGVT